MTCVSNPVGGPYVSTSNFLGVPLTDLHDRAGVQPEARRDETSSPRGVSIATGTGCSAQSPASASSSTN